ncbi:hypothetical protein CU102_03775 [Phyllobacterium brassicacearum]|uniref:Uncharacterized protein n=1 Tax=Phyllobacterium brassicacearum TaxID=314235 RepID=A0A2P7BUR8_9HYPH|nr:hypothetical protein CU102_03775 [Phyllobacterium brassicacearum]TDQ33894.1 hypothetical protein DEV91_10497 [Phyllobacterium brassicacearum]
MDTVLEIVLLAIEHILPKRLRWIVLYLTLLCVVGYTIYYFYLTWSYGRTGSTNLDPSHNYLNRRLVTINAQGIKDVRVSPDVIPWTRIQSIETRKIDRVWQILLRVDNASQLAFSPTYKGFRGDFDPASDSRTINITFHQRC